MNLQEEPNIIMSGSVSLALQQQRNHFGNIISQVKEHLSFSWQNSEECMVTMENKYTRD
jgi:hypothetical protein